MPASPDKQTIRRVVEMLGVGLLTAKHLQPWAASQIAALPKPPAWICELVSLTYHGDIDRRLREFVFSPPFEAFDECALSDYAVACLFVRYRRRDLSWATFLLDAGKRSDGMHQGRKGCDYYFDLLDQHDDSEFSIESEHRQVLAVSELFAEPIADVTRDFAPFLLAFREGILERRSN